MLAEVVTRLTVQGLTKNFPGAQYKGYHSCGDAEHAYQHARANNLIGLVPPQWRNHHFTTMLRTPCRDVRGSADVPSTPAPSEVAASPPPPPCTPQNAARFTPGATFDARLHATLRQQPPSLPPPPSFTPRADKKKQPLSSSNSRNDERCFFLQKSSTPSTQGPPPYTQAKTKEHLESPSIKKEEPPVMSLRPSPMVPGGHLPQTHSAAPPPASSPLAPPPASSPLAGVSQNNIQRRHPFGAPLVNDDARWWVVAVGNTPGVYFRR